MNKPLSRTGGASTKDKGTGKAKDRSRSHRHRGPLVEDKSYPSYLPSLHEQEAFYLRYGEVEHPSDGNAQQIQDAAWFYGSTSRYGRDAGPNGEEVTYRYGTEQQHLHNPHGLAPDDGEEYVIVPYDIDQDFTAPEKYDSGKRTARPSSLRENLFAASSEPQYDCTPANATQQYSCEDPRGVVDLSTPTVDNLALELDGMRITPSNDNQTLYKQIAGDPGYDESQMWYQRGPSGSATAAAASETYAYHPEDIGEPSYHVHTPAYCGADEQYSASDGDPLADSEFTQEIVLVYGEERVSARALFDTGNKLGHMISLRILHQLGLDQEDLDKEPRKFYPIGAKRSSRTLGGVVLQYYVPGETYIEEVFHVLETLVKGYDVLLSPEGESLNKRSCVVAASIASKNRMNEDERRQQEMMRKEQEKRAKEEEAARRAKRQDERARRKQTR